MLGHRLSLVTLILLMLPLAHACAPATATPAARPSPGDETTSDLPVWSRGAPTTFFRFSDGMATGPEFYEAGGRAFVIHWPVWVEAQRPPPSGFYDTYTVSELDDADRRDVVDALAAIDVAAYLDLPDSAFDSGPPDVHVSARLKLVRERRVLVDWHRDNQVLRGELAAPLHQVNQLLDAKYARGQVRREKALW